MNQDIFLLALRVGGGLALLGFMGSVVYFLYQDFRQAANRTTARLPGRGRLVVVAGGDDSPAPLPVGTVWPLISPMTLGRAATNTIPIDDGFASGEHARLVWRLGHWWLEDLHSSNGTQLNGHPVEEPIVLSPGDIIRIGNLQLRLELE